MAELNVIKDEQLEGLEDQGGLGQNPSILSSGNVASITQTGQQYLQNAITGMKIGGSAGSVAGPLGSAIGTVAGIGAGLLTTGVQSLIDLYTEPDRAKKAIENRINDIVKQNGGNSDPNVLPKVPFYKSTLFYIGVGAVVGGLGLALIYKKMKLAGRL